MDNREWKVVLSIETQLKRIADVLEDLKYYKKFSEHLIKENRELEKKENKL